MKIDCVLLYGSSTLPVSKYAGTFRIATELRQHDYTVQTIDLTAFNGFDSDLEEILDKILNKDTLWVGISTTFLHHIFGFPYFRSQHSFDKRFARVKDLDKEIRRFVDYVKLKSPKAKLIAGGSRRFMVEQFGFKVFKFYNDKEIIEFTDYCSGKNKNIDLKYLSNVIEGSEFAEFSTSKIEFADNDVITPAETLPMEISRGCIFRCKFCSFPMNGKTKGEWVKHTNILLDELTRNYEVHGVTSYVMSDDTYNDSPDKVKLLYDEVYSKLPFKLSFTGYIRLDLMMRYPDTIDYLKESGLASALFGIETINHESAKAIGKGVDPLLQFEFVKELKNNQFKNISTHSGIIIGLPKDRPDEMERVEEFIFSDKNCLDSVVIEPLFITPKDIVHVSKPYYSEFDLEYEKYGYECYEQIEDSAFTEIRWKNSSLGMTFDDAFAFSRKMNHIIINESDKFKYGGFLLPYYRSMGISHEDLLTLSRRQIAQKYDMTKILNDKKYEYRTNLTKMVNNVLQR
jgi:radical SAM superfamily enzyme